MCGGADPSPEETLQLNVSVVKASDPDESVFICAGCRQREVKRAQRKKDSKKNSEEAPEDNEPLDEALEDEKVVVFNATEFVEFENGQVVLPTRITCYCRHHKERIGFSCVSSPALMKKQFGTDSDTRAAFRFRWLPRTVASWPKASVHP